MYFGVEKDKKQALVNRKAQAEKRKKIEIKAKR